MSFEPFANSLQTFWTFLQQYAGELTVTIVGMVIVEVALHHYFGSREKPRIIIIPARSKDHRVGFGVKVEKKTVKHAMFICNNRKYDWEDENGNKTSEVMLVCGDSFKTVFPFQGKIEEIKDMSKFSGPVYSATENESLSQKGYLFKIEEISTGTTFNSWGCIIPKQHNVPIVLNSSSPQYVLIPGVSLRVIGDGIEEVRNYRLLFNGGNVLAPEKTPEGKSLVDYLDAEYAIREIRRFGLKTLTYP